MNPEINKLIQQFISGANTSLGAANAIEVALDDNYPDDDFVQQTVEMLAMYRPEGGDFLFDTAAIKVRLAETIEYLNRH